MAQSLHFRSIMCDHQLSANFTLTTTLLLTFSTPLVFFTLKPLLRQREERLHTNSNPSHEQVRT